MSIQAQRSRYKKSTATYIKDNFLDIIDIGETLSKNRFIKKVPLNDFIYEKNLKNNEKSEQIPQISEIPLNKTNNLTDLNPDNIDYENLNKNKFHINFYNLKLEYKNNYVIHFTQKYYPIKITGAGAFGLVISAIEMKTKEKLAVKIIDKKKVGCATNIESLNYQFKLLKNLDNPRIMKIYDILDNKRYVFIFMELVEGGTLKDLIIHRYLDNNIFYLFRDSECSTIMKGLLEALKYLHQNNIIHRDIKPENILFKKKNDINSLVICDFGLAYELSNYDAFISETCGTTIYMAPEILNRRGYDFLVDSFSAGIVLYELSSGGAHPFYKKGMSKKEYIDNILKNKCSCNFSTEMPLLARNLFLKLCKYEPLFRYEPYKALRHPWITRSVKSQIPMTLLEEYNKSEKIQIFKALLTSTMALVLIKKKYCMIPKKQPRSQSQFEIIDCVLNESVFERPLYKKSINNNSPSINVNITQYSREKYTRNESQNLSININKMNEFPILRIKTTRSMKKPEQIKEKNFFPKIEINKTKSLEKDYNYKNFIQLSSNINHPYGKLLLPNHSIDNDENINRNKISNSNENFLKYFSINARPKKKISLPNNILVLKKIPENTDTNNKTNNLLNQIKINKNNSIQNQKLTITNEHCTKLYARTTEKKVLYNLDSYSKKNSSNLLLLSNKINTKYNTNMAKKRSSQPFDNIFLKAKQNSKRLLIKDLLNVK